MDWQEQDARDRFSELVDSALKVGAQTVHRTAKQAVVVVSAEEYARLRESRGSFVDDLLAGPRWDDELIDLVDQRARRPSRDLAM